MSSLKVGVGLIGCGVMGRSLAKQLRTIEQAELVGVCDVDENAALTLGNELGVWATTNLDDLLSQESVDAVLIATPNHLHSEHTIAAAKAGKHVFCEKPMALTLDECDRMIAACKENGVNLMIGQVLRYFPIHAKVKEIVASGELGRLLCITMHRAGLGYTGVWDKEWRRKRELSGGMLFEVNIHELDFLRFVGGEVAQVMALGENFAHPDQNFPDCLLITLRFQSGALGFLHSSQVSIAGSYGGRVDCEKGSLLFPNLWDGELIVHTKEQQQVFKATALLTEDPVRQELREFISSILEQRPPAITGEDGRAAVALALAAYRSLETGGPVSLS